MAKKNSRAIDFRALQNKLFGQFRNLNLRQPANWPAVPRYALFALITVLVVVVLWFVWLTTSAEELEASTCFVQDQVNEYKQNGKDSAQTLALTDFCQALLGLNEFIYVD